MMEKLLFMKTKLTVKNPFGYDRYGFAFENLIEQSKCLDYGCYDGKFLHVCKQNKKIDFIGVDKNKDIIDENFYNEQIVYFEQNIPFGDNEFDCITILDVIEHISDQNKVLQDIYRVLKQDGLLIITTPKKNIFSFLDVGNFKFIFPKLHQYYYSYKYGKENYYYRYLNNPNGLIGDVEREKKWHQHFSENELQYLLSQNGFTVQLFDGSCFFQRVFIILDLLHLGRFIPASWREKDAKNFASSNLFCVARKNTHGHRF